LVRDGSAKVSAPSGIRLSIHIASIFPALFAIWPQNYLACGGDRSNETAGRPLETGSTLPKCGEVSRSRKSLFAHKPAIPLQFRCRPVDKVFVPTETL
jgi:hypothetical protein